MSILDILRKNISVMQQLCGKSSRRFSARSTTIINIQITYSASHTYQFEKSSLDPLNRVGMPNLARFPPKWTSNITILASLYVYIEGIAVVLVFNQRNNEVLLGLIYRLTLRMIKCSTLKYINNFYLIFKLK